MKIEFTLLPADIEEEKMFSSDSELRKLICARQLILRRSMCQVFPHTAYFNTKI
jgi:hypothetical protein